MLSHCARDIVRPLESVTLSDCALSAAKAFALYDIVEVMALSPFVSFPTFLLLAHGTFAIALPSRVGRTLKASYA